MIIISLVLGYVCATCVEYLLHRYYLHRSELEDHIVVHHQKYNSRFSFVHKDATYKEVASSNRYILMNVVIASPLALLLGIWSLWYTLIFLMTASLYAFGLEFMHYHFHKGSSQGLASTKWFKAISQHHFLHHKYYTINYGIGSRLWDMILGSYKKE